MISKSEERRNQILVGAFKLFLVKEYADGKLGGLRATDIGYSPAVNPYCVSLKSENSKLENICMNGAEFEKVTMNFEFKTPATYFGESYTFDLIQKDEQGNIVGGETFVVEAPSPYIVINQSILFLLKLEEVSINSQRIGKGQTI